MGQDGGEGGKRALQSWRDSWFFLLCWVPAVEGVTYPCLYCPPSLWAAQGRGKEAWQEPQGRRVKGKPYADFL
jgi:hypothetical protein